MDCSTPGFPVHTISQSLLKFTASSDAIQPSHPVSSPSLPVIVSIVTPCTCHEVMVETLSTWLLTPHHGWPRFQLCFRCLGNWFPFHCWLLAHWSCPCFGDFYPPSLPSLPPPRTNQAELFPHLLLSISQPAFALPIKELFVRFFFFFPLQFLRGQASSFV